jgi:hypothetical protein
MGLLTSFPHVPFNNIRRTMISATWFRFCESALQIPIFTSETRLLPIAPTMFFSALNARKRYIFTTWLVWGI